MRMDLISFRRPNALRYSTTMAVCGRNSLAYFQLLFAIDRIKTLAPQHPEWREQQPFKAVLENDMKALAAAGEHGLLELVMASHAGMTTVEFEQVIARLAGQRQAPTTGKPHTAMVYQPMLEVLDYLRANGFKTFIVSGGGIEHGPMDPRRSTVSRLSRSAAASRPSLTSVMANQCWCARPRSTSPMTRRASRSGSTSTYGRRPVMAFGNSMAICRCCSGPRAAQGRVLRDRPPHGRRARPGLRSLVA